MTGVCYDTCGRRLPGRRKTARAWTLPVRALMLAMTFAVCTTTSAQGLSRSSEVPEEESSEFDEPTSRRSLSAVDSDAAMVDVRVEGNTTIETAGIMRHIKSRPGRPPDEKQMRADEKALWQTGWFAGIERRIVQSDAGPVLVFRVIERPIVQSVEYQGNKGIKTKHLAAQTGIKRGSAYDVSKNKESARRLEDYYHDKGYAFATVELEKGDSLKDRDVVFKINEGKKVRVSGIKFIGNESFSDQLLQTKLATKKAILWYFGGKYDPTSPEEDIAMLRKYYTNLGYFDVQITDRVAFNEDRSRAYFEYTIVEGVRYKIGKREIEGNQVYSEQELAGELKLGPGKHFNSRDLNKDVESIQNKYYEQGRIFATVDAVPVFHEEPGVADLVYKINEDKPYSIRQVNVRIEGDNPHTKRSVILNQMRIAPGDLANKRLIHLSETRLRGSQYFMRDPANQPRIDIHPVVPAFAEEVEKSIRGQDDGLGMGPWHHDSSLEYQDAYDDLDWTQDDEPVGTSRVTNASQQEPVVAHGRHGRVHQTDAILASNSRQRPIRRQSQPRRMDDDEEEVVLPFVSTGDMIPSAFFLDPQRQYIDSAETIIRAQNELEETQLRGQSFEDGNPQPENPMFGQSPQGDPFGTGPNSNRFGGTGQADIDVIVKEERTGRLMFGVGVNSDAGVVGSIVLSENNFDLFRPPTSFEDILNGTAWRGAGQLFRLEAVPGSQVSRYMVSWTDPYVFNTNYSLGLSGFFYQRFFDDWDEQRAGGRIQVGRQWTPEWSTSVALRAEEVVISNPKVPTPQQLADVVGSNLLSTLRFSVAHDTRDSAFMPGAGHLIDLAYEQAFGDFSYPRAEAEARQYFTVYNRPDGEGKHTVSLGGNLGWTGDDTPVFENFFAGGFQSFRGFAFRGVGPKDLDVRVGGNWLALGSVEYMFPMLANETIHGVVFSDFGTVENDVTFDDFRVTAGAGLRITIPAMGPVPLAFDFAAPILKADGDETQVFSFYVGMVR